MSKRHCFLIIPVNATGKFRMAMGWGLYTVMGFGDPRFRMRGGGDVVEESGGGR